MKFDITHTVQLAQFDLLPIFTICFGAPEEDGSFNENIFMIDIGWLNFTLQITFEKEEGDE